MSEPIEALKIERPRRRELTGDVEQANYRAAIAEENYRVAQEQYAALEASWRERGKALKPFARRCECSPHFCEMASSRHIENCDFRRARAAYGGSNAPEDAGAEAMSDEFPPELVERVRQEIPSSSAERAMGEDRETAIRILQVLGHAELVAALKPFACRCRNDCGAQYDDMEWCRAWKAQVALRKAGEL